MAISAFLLLKLAILAHIGIGCVLILAPQKIAEQNTLAILGDALGLVRTPGDSRDVHLRAPPEPFSTLHLQHPRIPN